MLRGVEGGEHDGLLEVGHEGGGRQDVMPWRAVVVVGHVALHVRLLCPLRVLLFGRRRRRLRRAVRRRSVFRRRHCNRKQLEVLTKKHRRHGAEKNKTSYHET